MYFLGIDIGSMTAKTVIINNKKEIVGSNILKSGIQHNKALEISLEKSLNMAGIKSEELLKIVSTGYGRENVPMANRQVTEIACHAKGGHFLFPGTRTIIDIGGQDSKVIKVNKNGKVIDFIMNDKCAAGTGRFLEVMANALGVEVKRLGEIHMQSKKSVTISSMCGIFAESEVVTKIAQGEKKEDIINGIHNSIATRIISMLNRLSIEEEITMTGGGAKNKGVVASLEKELGYSINISEEPQILGALGAALIAFEEYNDE